MAAWKETDTLKPIEKAIARMVSESPGRNVSERNGGPERLKLRRSSLTVERRRQHGTSHLADAAVRSGGGRAAARWPGHAEGVEEPSSPHPANGGAKAHL